MALTAPIRLGISRCLLGDPVRYDGGHKRDDYLARVLGRQVEWVPVCPEVEAGFGVPREPMRLVGTAGTAQLVTIETRRVLTRPLRAFSARKLKELEALNLSGYVFKARSPSCGVAGVPLYDRKGKAKSTGRGLFAGAFRKAFPLIPITEETHLADPVARRRFLAQVYGYYRQRISAKQSVTRTMGLRRQKFARTSRRTRKP